MKDEKSWTDFDTIFKKYRQWHKELMIRFCGALDHGLGKGIFE